MMGHTINLALKAGQADVKLEVSLIYIEFLPSQGYTIRLCHSIHIYIHTYIYTYIHIYCTSDHSILLSLGSGFKEVF